MNAGLPIESAAWGINQVCGSGLRAVALGAQHIQLGDADVVAAGGQENMSLSPHAAHLRAGHKMGDMKYIDTMIRDGLWDAFNGYHMGQTAENVADKWQITRDQQDEFAVASQNKAEAAQKAGKFDDEVIPFTVKTRKGETVVDKDEYIRHGATMDAMQKLRPAFTKDGSVTAANASGLNDGAAAVLLMSAENAEKRGLEPLARIASYATAGLDPSIMGVGPIHASRKALEKAGWSVDDLGSGGGKRSLRRAGLCREQGHGLGPVDRERERRCDCHWPSHRRVGLPRSEHPAVRDEASRRQEGPRHAVYRWRHGCRNVHRAPVSI